ncbi:hypothetical protein KR100_10365 [Synechococcus sp. KORDI-100]|uniref:hypothetical protein n=1 Tax=Synechococcus sp. KORDI-100 TaxID=1280380 RepID=UPI0004E06E3C|nr:hypothetical protein KR100_10365 [Synechococcus sp. KORDI-100]
MNKFDVNCIANVVFAALTLLLLAVPVQADWLCDGDPLSIRRISGAVDISGLPDGIPNSAAGTLPGDGILINWRGVTLQLPRTNNAGTPSYTDGRWWWRAEDPDRPEFKERRGGITVYACEPVA